MDGLKAWGYEPVQSHVSLDADILVTWTPWRGSRRAAVADHFARQKKPVIVMENGWLSPVQGEPTYQVALDGWNGTGKIATPPDPVGGCRRWECFNVPLAPWKASTQDPVALVVGQRGMSNDDRNAPLEWHRDLNLPIEEERIIRRPRECMRPLVQDLAVATEVHVWSSNVASWAVVCGIPVVQHGPVLMVSRLASRPGEPLTRPDRTLEMRRLAWAQFTAGEISAGAPFQLLMATT